MLEIYAWLIDKVEDLLVYLSQKQCYWAKIRLNNYRKELKELEATLEEAEQYKLELQKDIDLLDDFLRSDNNVVL